MKISRELATPLTIGAFAVMGVTGILMFFHLDTGLNKTVHEWAGWVMVAGVAAHVVVNWRAFRNYFVSSRLGLGIISAGLLTLAVSFLPLTGAKPGSSPPVLAMKAIVRAPIASVAPIAGRSAAEIVDDLAKAGISLSSVEASIESVVGDDRGLQAKAMGILFRKK